jgi:rhodanese-related sulfurtransferase
VAARAAAIIIDDRMNKKPQTTGHKPISQPGGLPVWALIGGIALVVVVAVAAALLLQNHSAAPQRLPPEISVTDAAVKRDAGAFILDVRQPDEWVEYHVPGATLIPLGELEAHVKQVPQDKDIIVVCRSGNRSQTARDILLKAGHTRVTSMTGGLKEWRAQGFPTVSGQ